MDVAYDHVHEESLPEHQEGRSGEAGGPNDLQQAFQAVSASPWGARLGGWFSQARKQGEAFVTDLQKEAQDAQSQATQGWTSLVSRTRDMSLSAEPAPSAQIPGEEAVPGPGPSKAAAAASDAQVTEGATEKPESLPADIVKEAGTLVASLRSTAAARLKELQKAEDAADEALLKFGTNVRNFLRDAVTITAPAEDAAGKASSELLFETSEPGTGKKIFHTTRLDAQLHAIHTTASSFTEDPQGPQWDAWRTDFDPDGHTDAIARDLDKYEELRRAMEKLVPEKVDYQTFWTRYYFLRKAIDEDEKKRREHHAGATADEEEDIGWGDDDDDDDEDDEEDSPTPQKPSNDSTTTLSAPPATGPPAKPAPAARDSHEDDKSVVSDASYDSPKQTAKEVDANDSEDDWE
ncbi:domain in transcription factors and synapse-associated proteins [Teratosphaeria destructans]|uniref:Domain in transcription factors and synapse-associated proteins n=1 Tax=Teratosphaeria destructans TaxID=418781 RepID=A0A9W7W4Y0_9PEZI|nr:domain in transcription factors and synapse-associated proteins [Teratosphaeria destructans]